MLRTHRIPETRRKRGKCEGNLKNGRTARENSRMKQVSHTDNETRESTVQFSDRRPYSLVQFMDSLGLTDSRRRRTCTRAIFPLSLHPAKLPIVNGYLAYVAMLEEFAILYQIRHFRQIQHSIQVYNYYSIYKEMRLHFILYLLLLHILYNRLNNCYFKESYRIIITDLL